MRRHKPISFTEIMEQARHDKRQIPVGEAVVMIVHSAVSDRCGMCGACEATLFGRWAAVVDDGLPDTLEGPRLRLIEELHGSVADRFPLGIAERLYEVIGLLHGQEDELAGDALRAMASDEHVDFQANPGVLSSSAEVCRTARSLMVLLQT